LQKRDEQDAQNTPARPVKAPAARHYINRISTSTVAKEKTTLIKPGTPVGDDMNAIRNGRAIRDGERFTVNGRTYQMKPNGTMFPVEGDGFVPPVSRGVIFALNAYARYNGINETSEYEATMASVSEEDRERAREIWSLRERYRDGEGTHN
jgi:hypothetical protein